MTRDTLSSLSKRFVRDGEKNFSDLKTFNFILFPLIIYWWRNVSCVQSLVHLFSVSIAQPWTRWTGKTFAGPLITNQSFATGFARRTFLSTLRTSKQESTQRDAVSHQWFVQQSDVPFVSQIEVLRVQCSCQSTVDDHHQHQQAGDQSNASHVLFW